MKQQDLIDRYVYAVVRHLPRKQAEDIDRELHGLIEDMLCTRCGDKPVEEKDILVTLTELGTPQELAAQYGEDKENCLISQPYYSQYKMLLKWVLLAVIFGLSVSIFIEISIAGFQGSLSMSELGVRLIGWFGILLSSCLAIVGAITILYAFLQRRKINLTDSLGLTGNLKDLPPVPAKKEKISKADAIAGIIFSIIFIFLFLAFPQAVCVVFRNDAETTVIPFFSESAIKSAWFLFAGIGICGITDGAFQLIEGRYTLRLAAVNGICNVISILLCILLALRKDILNPRFLERPFPFTEDQAWISTFFIPNIYTIAIFVVIITTILDSAVVLCRALKYRMKD